MQSSESTERSEKRGEKRLSRRAPKGKQAWDKDLTRELFRRYKQEGDE